MSNKFVAVAIAAAVAVGSLTAGVNMASAATTTPKHTKQLTCKSPLVPTLVKETVKGKTEHVWKCEPPKHASTKKTEPKKPT